MDSRASAFWVRFKANRWPYTLTILATLSVGILNALSFGALIVLVIIAGYTGIFLAIITARF